MDNNFQTYEEAAEMLKALAHPVRLCIARGLLKHGPCNVSYMQDCLEIPQSTVSQHLQKLRTNGIVKAERHRHEIHYTIENKRVRQLILTLFGEESL
ncbi:metalloregulator ArsR/SmtB family transcription factor [Paenibacillus woosongensis]|uniref:Metalloregulator ArsR/SmtB family transcription factor n=1 Tax=Paenibacillus woosongensis TaxID=307580 RepID=A0AA95KWD6_9BACL|nr:metalloregulator ArsR/SmtB family transcription factor [Paenibacillus woosongensis]WHX49540.1 metalloregulator ArsR/SmtB family transcription factor [Paenibacillus woosongensis]